MKPCPLYLHYFDRELRDSTGASMPPTAIRAITNILLLATPATLYCALSGPYESEDAVAAYVAALARCNQIGLVSRYSTRDEFLASRVSLYSHDVSRYPMYFGNGQASRDTLRPTMLKEASATATLKADLLRVAASQGDLVVSGAEHEPVLVNNIRSAILAAFADRNHEAITFTMFKPYLGEHADDPLAAGLVRRLISDAYSRHFQDYGGADIPTGIGSLAYYDRLASTFPMHDIPLLAPLFRALGLRAFIESTEGELEPPFLPLRGQTTHLTFVEAVRRFLGGVLGACRLVRSHVSALPATRMALQLEIKRRLREPVFALDPTSRRPEDLLLKGISSIEQVIKAGEGDPLFAAGVEGVENAMNGPSERVLIVVATEREMRAITRAAGVNDHGIARRFHGSVTFHDLGTVGGCRLRVVRTQMGSGGVGGSQATIGDATQAWAPSAVVLLGIAFGLKPAEQKLGDILVSRQLMPYESGRVQEDGFVPRGPRVPSSRRLLDRFLSGQLDWTGQPVHFGLVLSGEKLVDSKAQVDALLKMEPEAIGGEMEGAGLYAAAENKKIDWIVVKGISDWGHNKGANSAQELAANNAATFVMHVVRQGGIAQGALIVTA